jgi:ring-1,2-phenylacetyl-CoA epoxidase subunit PaaC
VTSDAALIQFLTAMADDELILGHRDSEWTGHAPILEEDIAFSNIAQDEMGHALVWYSLARELGAENPDHRAFFRGAEDFTNATLVELPKGDWAFTIVRQYLFDVCEQVRYAALAHSNHKPIAEVVAKLRSEENYHLMHSSSWVERLGDATEESHRRMQAALDLVWPYALGLFEPCASEDRLVADGVKVAEATLREQWFESAQPFLEAATLTLPESAQPAFGGRFGKHTTHMRGLLDAMQKVARLERDATW